MECAMKITHYSLWVGLGCAYSVFAAAVADDRALSAIASCEVSLGNTTESGNGMKAAGGTSVIKCPLSKKLGTSNSNYLYARIHRAQSSGSDPFCYLVSTPPFGTTSSVSYGYAEPHAGAQSVGVAMPRLYSTGYLDLYCLLNDGDTFYGARHVQVD